MPYIIAVLALVVVGVGFTLYQPPTPIVDQPLGNDVADISDVNTDLSTSTEITDSTIVIEEASEYDDEIVDNSPGQSNNQTATTPPPIQTKPATESNPKPVENTTVYDYLDGTYNSQISYRTPEGNYSMNVTLTVMNDMVKTANTVFDSRTARDSYTKKFSKSYTTQVTGKDIDNINLSRVGGASLTSEAFNKAVADIKNQAKV